MDTTNIKKEFFKRDLSGEEGFLDDYWTLEVKNVAKNDSRLKPYFENVDYSDIEISVAGKASGVNEAAFQTALEVLSKLHVYLEKLSPTSNCTVKRVGGTLARSGFHTNKKRCGIFISGQIMEPIWNTVM